ncbi:559_t:CDS:2 [Ambispora gerdemannii]|uniref:559_t:CDS:1 n=1 Tax=Ambispora gerdemannii TaxID=144530 RepID=A0A9N9H8X8_9GLOM|nr:559_t:CDS:2 [Ambispora gerdemannii]
MPLFEETNQPNNQNQSTQSSANNQNQQSTEAKQRTNQSETKSSLLTIIGQLLPLAPLAFEQFTGQKVPAMTGTMAEMQSALIQIQTNLQAIVQNQQTLTRKPFTKDNRNPLLTARREEILYREDIKTSFGYAIAGLTISLAIAGGVYVIALENLTSTDDQLIWS